MLGRRPNYHPKAQTLGQKFRSGARRLGHKVADGTRAGVKWGVQHAGEIADISGKVQYGAQAVAKGLELAGAGIATTGIGLPLAGAVEAGAGLAEGVGAVAGYVSTGASAVQQAKEHQLIPKSYGG